MKLLAFLSAFACLVAGSLALPDNRAYAQVATPAAPTFDCKKAMEAAEKLICSHPELAKLDREIADAFATALTRLDAKGDAALRKEQGWFNDLREAIVDPDYTFIGGTPAERLGKLLESRRDFLNTIRKPTSSQSIAGKWRNYFGSVTIGQLSNKSADVTMVAVDPYAGRWICENDGKALHQGRSLILNASKPSGTRVTLSRDGDMISVKELFKAGEYTPEYCGHNGSLAGHYFLTK